MADDETTVKILFEADTSSVDEALKKTQQEAAKAAKKQTGFDRGSITASNKLIKNAVDSTKLSTKQTTQQVKFATQEGKFVSARKLNNKVQLGQLTNVTKLFALQNKETNKLYKTDSLRLVKAKQFNQVMKQSKQQWGEAQAAYSDLQTKRRASAAATQASIGGGWKPPPGQEQEEEKPEKKSQNIGQYIRPVLAAIASVIKEVADFVIQPMMQGYQAYLQFGRTAGRSIGQGDYGNIDFDRSQRLAFSKQETAEQAYSVARATGRLGAVTTAQETSRFYGGSVDEAAGFMGTLTRGGQRFNNQGGGQGRTTLFRTLRDATASGLDRSRVGEHLDAVAGAIESTGMQTARNVDTSQISGLLALIGSSGKTGFQGARGMNVLSQIHEGIRSGGRDEYSQALQLSAFGFGVAGQDTDYYTARRRQDEGIFGDTYGVDNLRRLTQTYMEAGGGNIENATLAAEASGSFGNLGLNQIRDLFETVLNAGTTEDITEAIDALRSQQGSVEEQIRDNLKEGQATIAQRVVDLDNRLVSIGAEVFPAMASIQDAVIDVQNTLLPAAIDILRTIATAVDAIRTVIAPFSQNAAEATDTELEKAAYKHRDAVLAAPTLEAAQESLRRLREVERQVDAEEHARFASGDTSGGSRMYHMGERLTGAEEIARRHIQTLEQVRAAEQRQRAITPTTGFTTTVLPEIDATAAAPRVNVVVNTPAATPNDSRQGVSRRGDGVYGN